MADTLPLKKLAEISRTGNKYPAMKLVGSNFETAAVLSKLVKDRNPSKFTTSDARSYYNLDYSEQEQLSKEVIQKIKNAENIMQLFPDLELAAQILISSILSPKDMVSTEVIYKYDRTIMPAALSAQIISLIEEEMSLYYKFKEILPDIIREALFVSGAYVKAIIPESAIDEIINNPAVMATESFSEILEKPSIGFLGSPIDSSHTQVTMESIRGSIGGFKGPYDDHLYLTAEDIGRHRAAASTLSNLITVTDNFKYLKLPSALKALASKNARNSIRKTAMESNGAIKYTDTEVENMFFKRPSTREVPFVAVNTKDTAVRVSVGRPMDIKIPTEATIPVHVPGDPKEHIGYFILLDEEGNPIIFNNVMNGCDFSQLNSTDNQISTMLGARARRNLMGSSRTQLNIQDYTMAYKGIVEGDLLRRLKNGIYGRKLEISASDHIYQIMLSRTLASQFTKLLYIPAELITYFAFNYTSDGLGKSLLEDLKVLTSLRAILLFAKVNAMAKNSIAVTHVNMTLDPDDPDPMKTIEVGMHEVMKLRQQQFPLGINTPTDLVDWIQKAGLEFTFDGHPGIPQTKLEFESKNFQHQMPDNELDEILRKQTIMAFGLSPETVDNGFASEFATTVVTNNILLSKRVLQWQDKLTPKMTQYVQHIIANDYVIRERLAELIKPELAQIDRYLDAEEKAMRDDNEAKFIDYLIDLYAENLIVALPRPDVTSIETQSQAFQQQEEALDKALEYWVSSTFMTTEIAGEFANMVDAVKASLKAYFMRQWMSENGFMSQLADITSTNEEDKPIIDLNEISKDHMEGVMRTALQYIESLKNARIAANKDIENMDVEGSGPMDTSSSDSDSGSDEGMDDTGSPEGIEDDLGDGLDFDMGDDGETEEPV